MTRRYFRAEWTRGDGAGDLGKTVDEILANPFDSAEDAWDEIAAALKFHGYGDDWADSLIVREEGTPL